MSSSDGAVEKQDPASEIRSRSCPQCILCGSSGEQIYRDLRDRLFSAPGVWNLSRCPDPACGLLWLDPMPIEEDISNAYKDYFTHEGAKPMRSSVLHRIVQSGKRGYLANRFGSDGQAVKPWEMFLGALLPPPVRRSAEAQVMFLGAGNGRRVLDVGCGSGEVMESLIEAGWEAEGVDFDAEAVAAANRKGLKVRVGSLAEQKYDVDSFDAIVMSHVIEHVTDPLAVLRECRRILRPEAELVLATPNSGSWGHRRFGRNWMPLDPPRHLHIFNPLSVTKLVKLASLELVAVRTTVRAANSFFAGSLAIERNGQHRMGERFHPVWARSMQVAEALRLSVNPMIGEELVVVAKKGSSAKAS